MISYNDAINDFREWALNQAGIELPPDIKETFAGKIERFHIAGHKAGSLNGAYTFHSDGKPAGSLEDFVSGFKSNWTYQGDYQAEPISQAEVHQRKNQAEKERAKQLAERIEKAVYIWNQSKPLTDTHPYLVRKSIKGGYGLRVNVYKDETSLVIPFGKDGALKAIQTIKPEKPIDSTDKKIIGEKNGCYFILNKQQNPRLIAIAEGLATIASIAEDDFIQRKGFMCVMGIDADNLPKVAAAMRDKYPQAFIVLFGDKDDHGKGQKKALEAAELVSGYCVLPPMETGDFNDYLNGPITVSIEDLIMSIADTALWQALEPDNAPMIEQFNDIYADGQKPDHETIPAEHAPLLTVLDGDDMAINAKPPNYMINDIIETDAHGILFGASQSFKSFCALRMAYSVCTGEPFFNHEVFTTGKVLYICGEGKGALERRIRALFLSLGCFNGNFKYIADIVSIDTPESMARVKDVIAEYKPVLVILDTFSSLAFNTPENDNSEVAKALALIRETCTNGVTSSFVVHHNGKNAALGERGAGAFGNNTDFRFELKREPDTMITTLSCPKQKDGEPFAPIHIKAEIVQLGIIRQDGKEATSLVLKPCDDSEKPSKQSKPLSLRSQDVLTELHKAIDQHGIEPPPNIKALFPDSPQNIPDKVVKAKHWQVMAYKVIEVKDDSKDIGNAKSQAFYKCKTELKNANKTGFYDDYYWINNQSLPAYLPY